MPKLTTTQSVQHTRDKAAPKPALSCAFSIGPWQVFPQLNRIRLNSTDEERQLEPRLMHLLCFLGANHERVLSREELIVELWPQVVVNENSLTRAISELRKQLRSQDTKRANYIETIPKRGYRLLPGIEHSDAEIINLSASSGARWATLFATPILGNTAVSAACLCLAIITGWFSLQNTEPDLDPIDTSTLLSDELLGNTPNHLGGELQLTSKYSNPDIVTSPNGKQYAFIQYDERGSRIFLGNSGSTAEPISVYYNSQQIFNLAWSPVKNRLLFALKPSIATAAVYSTSGETIELLSLNLNTLEVSRLVEDNRPSDTKPSKDLSLT